MAVDIIARGMAASAAQGGGGSSLPPVSDTDDGKVLSVVSGAWGAEFPQKDYSVDVEKEVVVDDTVVVNTPTQGYYTGNFTGDFDYEKIRYDSSCLASFRGTALSTMPIHYYYQDDCLVIGGWDAEYAEPTLDYGWGVYIGGVSGDAPDIIVYSSSGSQTPAPIIIEKQPLTVEMSEDFLIASAYADSLIMVCPPQVVTMADATAKFNENGYIDSFNVLTYMPGPAQTYVYIDGVRATYTPEYNGWYIHGESHDYLLSPYQVPNSNPPHYYLTLTEDRPTTSIHENHTVSVWFDVTGVGIKLAEAATVHFRVSNGAVYTDATYESVRACVMHNIPIVADINGMVCTTIPVPSMYNDNSDELAFQAIAIDPLIGSDALGVTVHTVYAPPSGSWEYTVSGYRLQIADDIVT